VCKVLKGCGAQLALPGTFSMVKMPHGIIRSTHLR
jgi:hypothetical protein